MGRRIRKVVAVSLDPSVHVRIKQEAEENRLSVSRYVEQALAEGFSPGKIVDQTTRRVKVAVKQLIDEHEERTRSMIITSVKDLLHKLREYHMNQGEGPAHRDKVAALFDDLIGEE